MTLKFNDVFEVNEYQQIQDLFSKNLEVGSITVSPSGEAITKPSSISKFCEHYIQSISKEKDNCVKCAASIGKLNVSGPNIKQCLNHKGLSFAQVSIVVEGIHIANWCIGQVKNVSVKKNNDTTDIIQNALDEIPLMTKDRFLQVAKILYLFVNELAEKAHKNLMLKRQLKQIEKANELLQYSERRFKLLFDKSNDAIFVINYKEGKYVDANESAEKLTGRTHQEILNLQISDLSPKDAQNVTQSFFESENKDIKAQIECLRPDGTIRKANIQAIHIDQELLFGIAQDVTEQIKSSEDLKQSNDLLQYIIEHNLSAIAIHDKDLRYLYVSKKYLEYFNLEEKQIIGKHHYDIFPNLPQKWRDVHQLALKGVISRAEEDSYEREDGSIEWAKWECRPWYDKNKEIAGIIINTEMITERKNLEISLRESEEKYKFMFYNNPQPSGIYDVETLKFLEINDAAVIHYGYSREEFLDMTLKDFIPKEHIVKLMGELSKGIPKFNKSGPWVHIKKNGELIYVESYSHLIDYRGKQARHLLINDITDKIRYEQEIKASQKRAEESDKLKSAFLANMSHEIRTPLNSILGFSELLIDPLFTDEDKKGFLNTVLQNGERLLSLINDILDLSKIESGQLHLKISTVNINELLNSIFNSHLLSAEKKGITLKLNTTDLDPRLEILSDNNRIAQVLNILISNALKFIERGFIEFGMSMRDDFVQFFVKDTGIGIPEDYHKLIFERFSQVDQGSSRKFEGSGLGLTIAKTLVELLGGKIWLESTFGEGTTFYFTIPKMYKG